MIRALFSSRGRVTRGEFWIAIMAWLAVLGGCAFLAKVAAGFGYRAALWIYFGLAMASLSSLHAMAVRRAHDYGHEPRWWSFNGFAVLFRRGIKEPNTHGPAPNPWRVRRLALAASLAAFAAYVAAAFAIDRFATAYCTPYVSATAATGHDAEQRWEDAVTSVHGLDYVSGVTVGRNSACGNGSCRVSARACRRP